MAGLGGLAQASPWGAAIGAVAQVATPAPAGPSEAKSSGSIGGSNLDNSGWNVTFGNNSGIKSDRDQTQPGNLTQAAASLMGNPAMLIGLGVVALVVLKKLKRR